MNNIIVVSSVFSPIRIDQKGQKPRLHYGPVSKVEAVCTRTSDSITNVWNIGHFSYFFDSVVPRQSESAISAKSTYPLGRTKCSAQMDKGHDK
jgi:hypothetical protein